VKKKKEPEKDKKIEHWIQMYLQAKENGDTKLMKMYEAIIKRLNGQLPKL